MADEEKTEETAAEAAGVESAASAEMNNETASAVDPTPEATPADSEAQATEPEAAAPAVVEATPAEPQVQLKPKERKAANKAKKAAKVGQRGETSNEERQAERDAVRAKKAIERRAGRAKARAKWKAGAHERTATPAREHETGQQKTRQGVVVSDKADKTITVRIDVARRHRKYQKIVRTSTTFHAHDELNDANAGDTVVIRESRPLSRSKRWRLVEVVERAK
jgi:small subunit ribosomal protein S17